MGQVGTEQNPLRVAIIGAGPTGFYAAEHLFKQKGLVVEVDLYDRLPTPFGLVRGGVAPDHQKIKSVTKAYDRTAANPRFRFYGYVEFGSDVSLDDLKMYYHQILFSTGAQTDRNLGVPGEDLKGSHAATEFVAWYNGHPDYRDREFDLSKESAAVIGVGNVAVDVARILCRTPEELAETDIADYAEQALRASRIKDVYMIGRRGPAQAAFTNPEIKEMGEMPGADIVVLPEEAELDELSKKWLETEGDKTARRNVEIVQEYARRGPTGKPRRLHVRFLESPVELIGNDAGEVESVRIVCNELYAADDGTLRPRATDRFVDLPVGLVFRSVGYRGVPLPGVPFHEKWGVIPNEKGRVIDPETKTPVSGLYTAGWIKRGPSGVIGTNKPDALETVECMVEDLGKGLTLHPSETRASAVESFIRNRKPSHVSWRDWQRLDEIEVTKGNKEGRPRVKFTTVEDMQAALDRQSAE
ncbi:MAG: FAD-dependent oxidoreductase [Vicinamibacteria bacterium]